MSAFLDLVLQPIANPIRPEWPPFFTQNGPIPPPPIRRQKHPDLSRDQQRNI